MIARPPVDRLRPFVPSDSPSIDFFISPAIEVALSLLPVWCWREIADRLRRGSSALAVFDELLGALHRDDEQNRSELRARSAAALGRAAERAIGVLPITGAYPAPLAAIPDPPPVLWFRGSVAALALPAVAIVGSRAGSSYALAVAERLSADLAVRGIAVVSGLARGVDSAAHRGALSAGGTTIAVLGSGVDVVYPREHEQLAMDIAASGGLVLSELVPGSPPRKSSFPRRNRLISGCSLAVVVVEAGERSGSLITARAALEQGRDVLAVPGNVLSGRNRGAHALLRDGAKIVETADDIVEELGFEDRRPRAGDDGPGDGRVGCAGDAQTDPLLACMAPGEPCELDELAARTGLPSSTLLARLLDLEMSARVRRVDGGRFVRVDITC